MILTTTNSVEDYKILTYKGIVSGSAVNMPKMTLTFNMDKYTMQILMRPLSK